MSDEKQRPELWNSVKAICSVIIVLVIAAKIYATPMSMTVDFPTLLSLLLALFSVALAALFYFKATDTSNTFYDNTYKFTRDIAQLLAKMESGFGERLRHLDEGYSSMRSHFQGAERTDGTKENVENTKNKLEDEKQEVRKIMEERSRIVHDLIERSQLQKHEKDQIAAKLTEKEEELAHLQKEVTKLNRRLMIDRVRRDRDQHDRHSGNDGMDRFTRSNVVEKIGRERLIELPPAGIRRAFSRLANDLPRGYVDDLERMGCLDDDGLTPKGAEYLKAVARDGDA